MSSTLSKAAIDRAGKRLRDDAIPRPEDVAIYNEYRASLEPALAEVEDVVRSIGGEDAVSSRLKRLDSVIAKLRRGDFKLTQIQDIAGCRLLVLGLVEQDAALSTLLDALDCRRVTDYRTSDHIAGYTAVHMLCRADGEKPVEVQIRTLMQQLWALTSERLAHRPSVGMDIKYGTGPLDIRARLQVLSGRCREYDLLVGSGRMRAAELNSVHAEIEQEVADLLRLVDNGGGGN